MSDIEISVDGGAILVTVTGGQGPPGSGGETVIFEQTLASNHWIVNHLFPGGFPSVTIVDTSGNVLISDVHYINSTTLEIFFSVPVSGKVYMN